MKPLVPAWSRGAAFVLTCAVVGLASPATAQTDAGRLRIDSAAAARMAVEYTSEGTPAPLPAGPMPRLTLTCDRESAVYKVGEDATITMQVQGVDGNPYEGKCSYRITDEDSKTLSEDTLIVRGGKAVQRMKGDRPGFYRMYVTVPHSGGEKTDLVTIGVEPERIQPTQTQPDDFMEFWMGQKLRLDATPRDLHRVEFDGPDEAFRYEYIDFRNVDNKRFYFLMTQPKVPGKYQIQFRIPGAGIYKRHVPLTTKPGTICVEVSIHDFPINQSTAWYEEVIPRYYRLINGKKERYDKWDNHDRERYYYNSVILGLWRTLDIACEEPNADMSRVVVTGGSQGGGLSLALGGLDRRISYLNIKYPVFCDHTAGIREPGRQPGWPRVLDVVERPELLPDAIRTSAYYDNCNFARFVTAPVFIAQGFNDRVCPPGGTYAAVSLIRSPKMFYVDPASAHQFTPMAAKRSTELEAGFRALHLGSSDTVGAASGAKSPLRGYDFVVAADGTGMFRTIQEAVNACRDYSERDYRIFIKSGRYREKLVIPGWKRRITLVGEDVETTVITYDDHAGKLDAEGKKMGTFRSFTCMVSGTDISFENITFENTAGQVGQAVAMHVDGDRCVFRNCRFLGNQDTLLAAGETSRQYFDSCTIEGTTDFIFGPATALFRKCTILSKKNSYITAASTVQAREFGFVFLHCRLVADSSHRKVYLGRPWRLYAATAFIGCEMGGHIVPEGWHNWSKPEAEKTARYVEYGSTGPGGGMTERVGWSRQLTAEEAGRYTIEKVLGGYDGWNPTR
ncbi:MAG: acetylxylan esterase [Bacteroidetes bacterium]|nr:acetylxylan esterase [Bacteroidota bacterium]